MQQQQHPSQPPLAKPRDEKTLRRIHPSASRIEAEQSSLYRRHTKPFDSWEPFSPFVLHCVLDAGSVPFVDPLFFARCNYFHSLESYVSDNANPVARARDDAAGNSEFAETLVLRAAAAVRRRDEDVISRLNARKVEMVCT